MRDILLRPSCGARLRDAVRLWVHEAQLAAALRGVGRRGQGQAVRRRHQLRHERGQQLAQRRRFGAHGRHGRLRRQVHAHLARAAGGSAGSAGTFAGRWQRGSMQLSRPHPDRPGKLGRRMLWQLCACSGSFRRMLWQLCRRVLSSAAGVPTWWRQLQGASQAHPHAAGRKRTYRRWGDVNPGQSPSIQAGRAPPAPPG